MSVSLEERFARGYSSVLDNAEVQPNGDAILSFYLHKTEYDAMVEFLREQDAIVYQKQKEFGEANDPNYRDKGGPYYGCGGGNSSITFAPTGLGLCTEVHHPSGVSKSVANIDLW